ncbi:LPS translocon maturation chaperone LptM [Phocoenobacter skyensis]|uniref:Lipoprotein n=1 Tax=Phocoenobacter skyensis TaxID=97481 RepID=A0AAJ6N8I0_9PAST|nr:lipoprotein [Pasteurella skyensis]MDP8078498.1 lipoprotein [Pasteurella skyensis]MDP8084410.1 lipoprotein [Pasteurella skyensis]MDP8161975.1 lipoprotein [Pasteurella skyensis]MDP8170397.1 lipoprotein [Pasteurella skyensis]MDP8172131.1 lipoprotein [Pasteurella skyensis]
MKKWIVIAMLAVVSLTACGVKGALYFPTEQSEQQTK